jgi:hypothetical protein
VRAATLTAQTPTPATATAISAASSVCDVVIC